MATHIPFSGMFSGSKKPADGRRAQRKLPGA